jgi:Pentapeptide repeats (8 copies)
MGRDRALTVILIKLVAAEVSAYLILPLSLNFSLQLPGELIPGAHLRDRNLFQANFSRADLQEADLRGASLSVADLSRR